MTASLDPADLDRIAEAVAKAEEGTAAEIRVCVVERPLVEPRLYILLWAALGALILPWPVELLRDVGALRLLALQAGLFVLLCGLLALPPLRHRLVPKAERRVAAQALAARLFRAHGVHLTEQRTGLLILVAPTDRLVEVVADSGVHALVGEAAWIQMCTAVAERARRGVLGEGIVAAVLLAGEILSAPIPREATPKNEVPDRVVVV